MALINPVHTFVVPCLFVVTVPLAVFAGITTTLAFSVLSFRVILVYLDIALSLVPQVLGTRKTRYTAYARRDDPPAVSPAASASALSVDTPTPAQPVCRRHRSRPSSVSSFVSAGSATPVGDMAMGLMPSIGPDRDFEGIGGWRSDRDDDTWTTINSRFELPDRSHARNHHRSPSGGPVTSGDSGVLMMNARARSPEARGMRTPPSPSSHRARTPSASRMSVISIANSDGYFPLGHVAHHHPEAHDEPDLIRGAPTCHPL